MLRSFNARVEIPSLEEQQRAGFASAGFADPTPDDSFDFLPEDAPLADEDWAEIEAAEARYRDRQRQEGIVPAA